MYTYEEALLHYFVVVHVTDTGIVSIFYLT